MSAYDLNPPRAGFHKQPDPGVAFEKTEGGTGQIVGAVDFQYPADDCDRGNPLAGFDEGDTKQVITLFGSLFGSVLQWLYVPKNARLVGMRVKALLYCVRPDLIGGSTLQQIAEAEGVEKQTFQALTRSFRQRFGIICRSMRTDEARENMRAAAFKAHSKKAKTK